MNLVTCKLCGRLFSAARGKICVTCLDELDGLYPKVREFLRDHSKENFNVEQIADGMDLDIRYVQALVELGYLASLSCKLPHCKLALKVDKLCLCIYELCIG